MNKCVFTSVLSKNQDMSSKVANSHFYAQPLAPSISKQVTILKTKLECINRCMINA